MEPEQTSTKNNGKSLYPMLIVLVLVVVGAIFFAYSSLTKSKNAAVTPQEENVQDENTPVDETENMIDGENATTDQSVVTIINVEAGSFYYKPNEIRVKLGDTVKIGHWY